MGDSLRKKAEKLLSENPLDTPMLSTVEMQQLFHELEVHQVELEMQNAELRQAQQELSATRDGYAELYDFAPVGYLSIDPEGRIFEANFTAATLLGLDRRTLLAGRTFSSFVHRSSLHTWDTHLQQISGTSGRRGVDLALKRKNEQVLTVRVEYTPRPASGQYLMALTDITERVHAEALLKESERDLFTLNRQLKQLVNDRSAELHESEGRFRALFEQAPDAHFLFDLDHRFISGNKAVERLTGYPREQLIGQSVFESGVIPASARGTEEERIERLERGESLAPIEYMLLRRDGTELPVEISTIPLLLQGESVYLSTARDLSQRKEAEAERARLDRQCRIAMDAAQLGWWRYNPDTEIVTYDRRFAEIYGLTGDECSSEEQLERLHPGDRPSVIGSVAAALDPRNPQLYKIDCRVNCADGSLRWYEAHGTGEFEGRGDARRAIALSGTIADITERKQTEAALRDSEAHFRSTLNNVLVGVVVHAADSSVLFGNPQAGLLLGLNPEQMLGKQANHPGWHFLHEDLSVMTVEDYPVSRVIATGKKFVYDSLGIQQPDSVDITWLTGSAIPVFTQEGVLDRIVVNFMDVTELKRLQDLLEKRVVALTHPLDHPEGIAFEDLFNLSEIQRTQDQFSTATSVASIITRSDGTPITEPSNFVELCTDMARDAEEVSVSSFTAQGSIERHHPEGPVIRLNPSNGLWDAAASIAIGGRHVANWLIGQARDESWTEQQMRAYAREIGADETAVIDAYSRVPAMTQEHFDGIAQALFTLAMQLSTSAYQNVQQARFIEDQKRTKQALQESEEKYRRLFESESNAILIFDDEIRRFIDVNEAAVQLYGYTHEEFLHLAHSAITTELNSVEFIFPMALAGENLPTYQSLHRKKDGTVFPVEMTPVSYSLQGRKVFCGVIRDVTERLSYENERDRNREELRKLASELTLAEQRERERIGRELHDGVSQLMSSSLLRLTVLKDSPLPSVAVKSLETICEIVTEALEETRSLTFELSCPMLHELGLAAALDELCSSMRREYSIQFEFTGAKTIPPISMDRNIALYRSTRELLINVMKHSAAKWACVHLEQTDDCVRICVEDDGIGFDSKMAGKGFSPTGGFGLFSIREYIRHAGGNLQIKSLPGDGTEVVLSVPLEASYE